jgi:uncharacterized membrane protein YdcZ (DUF606 family)
VKLIKALFSIQKKKQQHQKYSAIAKMRIRWWTLFGGSKSLGDFIQINVCKNIVLNNYVNINI